MTALDIIVWSAAFILVVLASGLAGYVVTRIFMVCGLVCGDTLDAFERRWRSRNGG